MSFWKTSCTKTEEDGCKVTLQHLYSVHCLPSSSQWRLISIILLTFFHRCYISGNGANCGNCNTKGWRGGFDFLKGIVFMCLGCTWTGHWYISSLDWVMSWTCYGSKGNLFGWTGCIWDFSVCGGKMRKGEEAAESIASMHWDHNGGGRGRSQTAVKMLTLIYSPPEAAGLLCPRKT